MAFGSKKKKLDKRKMEKKNTTNNKEGKGQR
jgi:hypothetical protein